MRVYLDTSVYNRPFDDQTQAKIFLETQAVLIILQKVEDKEIELIKKALNKYNGRRKKAAQELGISERTLYRKIKQYDLE